MSITKADAAALGRWVDRLIATRTTYGVVRKVDRFVYDKLSSSSELRLDHDVTSLPPKKYFLPQVEDLLTFSKAEGYKSVVERDPFVLIGVHPYDVFAISQLDTLFSDTNPDTHYLSRREAATIVACDVQTPSENVFAASMGTATVESGYDVLLSKIDGSVYVVEAATPKGEELVATLERTEATSEDLAAREALWERNRHLLRKHELKPAVGYLPKLLGSSYDHSLWEENATRCFSCGSCNLVCPTCYCFDVQDDLNWDLASGRRYRIWDGCMLTQFAVCAGGHNFRGARHERYRHRYYRKGKYIPEKIGQTGCVGCGRCISACVAKIANPVEVYNRLLEG